MITDLEKIAVILAKRPVEGVYHDNFMSAYYIDVGEFGDDPQPAIPFDPFNSIDQAMMLLEGMEYEIFICSNDTAVCRILDNTNQVAEEAPISTSDNSPARAITEAVYKYVEVMK